MSLLCRNDNGTVITMLSGISTRAFRISAFSVFSEHRSPFLLSLTGETDHTLIIFLTRTLPAARESGRGLTLINPRRDLTLPPRVSKTNDGRGN